MSVYSFSNSTFAEGIDNDSLTNYGNSTSLYGDTTLSDLVHGPSPSLTPSRQLNHLMPAQQTGFLHTPSAQQLFHNWQCASETSNRVMMLYQQALQENTELRSKVRNLETQLQIATQHSFNLNNNPYDLSNLSWPMLMFIYSHSRHQSTTSFTDSVDSAMASRVLTPEHDIFGRPLQYPLTVLWTFEDCKKDPSIDFTAANEARVSLHKIIRHPNGTMISTSVVKAIMSRARPIVDKILARIPSHIQPKDVGKAYLRTTYPAEWDLACQELESTQPLLKLCAGHWKAEFVLAQVIKSTKRGKRGWSTTAPVMTASRPASPEPDATITTSRPPSPLPDAANTSRPDSPGLDSDAANATIPEPNVANTTQSASLELDAIKTTATGAHSDTETQIITSSGLIPKKRKQGDSNEKPSSKALSSKRKKTHSGYRFL